VICVHRKERKGKRWALYLRSKLWLRRPKKPLRELSLLSAELLESLRPEVEREVVQFPAPPRPTCHTAPPFSICSRVFWRSSSSSNEKMARSEESWMFPAPPRPELNLGAVGSSWPRTEAGPRAVAPLVVLGVLKVFPAPPRPEWMYLPACG
jgi:hypothetical protein